MNRFRIGRSFLPYTLIVAALLSWAVVPRAAHAQAQRVNLNTATEQQLEELPGVGAATAKKIIAGRPYKSVDDLAKAGVPQSEITKLTPLVTVGSTARTSGGTSTAKPDKAPAKVDLNSATESELQELPGVGAATAKKIVAGRPYKSVDDLAKAGVSQSEITKLAPVVTVGSASRNSSAATADKAEKSSDKINLNSATQEELETLPGVGAATAKKIVAGRPYKSVDDLAKAGVSKAEIEKITAQVTVASAGGKSAGQTTPKASKVDLNSASQSELEELPGVGTATAKRIIAGRPYKTVDDLSKSGVSASEIARLTPLVSVGSPKSGAQPKLAGEKQSAKPDAGNPTPDSHSKINLNTATQTELEALPGVGPATAKKIIAARPLSRLSDLSKSGVSQSEITRLTPLVTVGSGTSTKTETPDDATPARVPPKPGMVWVNTDSKIFHRPGDRWYGKTKQGQFMTEQEAIKQGFRESKESPGSGNSSDAKGK